MNLSKRARLLIISSVYAFAFWSVPAESGWLNTEKEIAERFEAGYITFQDPVANQNIQLAQAKSAAERKQEAENAEQAALKKLEALKKKIAQRKQAKEAKKQAEIEEAQEQKRKDQEKLEEQRQLRIKEAERLKAEEIARIERAAEQEKTRQANFIAKLGNHACSKYDVNNKKESLACIRALEKARDKKNKKSVPIIWKEKATCRQLKKNIGDNLRAMGFWEKAVNNRTPDCKMFSDLYKMKFEKNVYWSNCVEKTSSDDDQVFACINSETKRLQDIERLHRQKLALIEEQKRREEAVKASELRAEKERQDYYVKATIRNAKLSNNNAFLKTQSKLSNDEAVLNHYIDLVVAQLQFQIFKEISDTVDNRLLILGLTYAISDTCISKFKKFKWDIIAPHLTRQHNANSDFYKNNQWFKAGLRYIRTLKKREGCDSVILNDIWYKSIIWIGEETDWRHIRLSRLSLVKENGFQPKKLGTVFPGATMDIAMLNLTKGDVANSIRKGIWEDVSFESERRIKFCRYVEDKYFNNTQTYLFWLNTAPSKQSRNLWKQLSSHHPLLKIPATPIKGNCPATAKQAHQLGASPVIKSYSSRLRGFYMFSCSYSSPNITTTLWYKNAPSLTQLKKKRLDMYVESPGSTPYIGFTECPTSWKALTRISAEFTNR